MIKFISDKKLKILLFFKDIVNTFFIKLLAMCPPMFPAKIKLDNNVDDALGSYVTLRVYYLIR